METCSSPRGLYNLPVSASEGIITPSLVRKGLNDRVELYQIPPSSQMRPVVSQSFPDPLPLSPLFFSICNYIV